MFIHSVVNIIRDMFQEIHEFIPFEGLQWTISEPQVQLLNAVE